MKQKYLVTVVKRSCVTGNPVWLYRGYSKAAARKAYQRACHKEVERVKDWAKIAARRVSGIRMFLADCMAELPINAKLTEQQREAIKQLRAIENGATVCQSEFYEHIMMMRLRRNDRKS